MGESALLFLIFIGHAAVVRNEIHAVMLNGKEFINLKDFVICCAKEECLVFGVFDCSREIIDWTLEEERAHIDNFPGQM